MRGLTRSVIALIVPPLPAPSRPSKRMQTLRPFCTTHCWSLTNSTCRRASSCSYSFRFSLPSAPDSSFLASLFLASVIGSSRRIRFHIQPCPRNCSNVSYVQLRKLPVIENSLEVLGRPSRVLSQSGSELFILGVDV